MIVLVGLGLFLVSQRGGVFSSSLKVPNVSVATTPLRDMAQNIDHSLAQTIRRTADEGISFPRVGSWQAVNEVGQATLSAEISTTPEELWQTLRQEGSQSVLQDIAQSAEFSVNDVSTKVMKEARYQYCVGVVDEYERQASPVPSSRTP